MAHASNSVCQGIICNIYMTSQGLKLLILSDIIVQWIKCMPERLLSGVYCLGDCVGGQNLISCVPGTQGSYLLGKRILVVHSIDQSNKPYVSSPVSMWYVKASDYLNFFMFISNLERTIVWLTIACWHHEVGVCVCFPHTVLSREAVLPQLWDYDVICLHLYFLSFMMFSPFLWER